MRDRLFDNCRAKLDNGKARQRGNKKVPGTHSQATTKVYANTHHTHAQVKTKEPENGDPSNQ